MDLRRYEPEDIPELTVAAARAPEMLVVRDEAERWWAIDSDRRWLRLEADTWSPGRPPRSSVVGPRVAGGPEGTSHPSSDWSPPSPPSEVDYEPPPTFAEPQAEPSDARERDPELPRRRRRKRGPGFLVVLGAAVAGSSVFLTWTRGEWGVADGFGVGLGFVLTGDRDGGWIDLGIALLAVCVVAAVLSFFRGALVLTRLCGALIVATAVAFLGRVSQSVTEAKAGRIGGADVFDVLGGAAFIAFLGGILVFIGRPGRREW